MTLIEKYEELPYLDEDYNYIMEEYGTTEILFEIIYFLDWFFPDWKSNRALGAGSSEFIRHCLDDCEEAYDEKNSLQGLISLYSSVAYAYERSLLFHTRAFSDFCVNRVIYMDEYEFEDYFDKEESTMTSEEIEGCYDKYYKDHLDLVPFTFE